MSIRGFVFKPIVSEKEFKNIHLDLKFMKQNRQYAIRTSYLKKYRIHLKQSIKDMEKGKEIEFFINDIWNQNHMIKSIFEKNYHKFLSVMYEWIFIEGDGGDFLTILEEPKEYIAKLIKLEWELNGNKK